MRYLDLLCQELKRRRAGGAGPELHHRPLSSSYVNHGVADIPAFPPSVGRALGCHKPPWAGGHALRHAGHRMAGVWVSGYRCRPSSRLAPGKVQVLFHSSPPNAPGLEGAVTSSAVDLEFSATEKVSHILSHLFS
jgi:hypothetical protein